jgi:Ran GTPase-activating protein (RanGAP) involved in mRNA processing and transport
LSPAFVALVPSIAWSDLEVMKLSGVKFTARDLGMLTYFLETNTAMRELCLAACGLDAPSVAVLAKVLAHSATISTVDLSWNSIGKQGGQALSQVLSRQCKALRTLILHGCNMGSAGAEFLAGMLRQNRTLTRLDLPYNGLGPTGAAALAEVLPLNRALCELDLRGNGLGPAGGLAIAAGLLHNRPGRLRVVKVADNKLGEAAAAAVAAAMRGTASEGLRSFSHKALNGPYSVSGTLHDKKRAPLALELPPAAGSLDDDDCDDGSEDSGFEVWGAANCRLPAMPGVRLLSGV